MAGSTDVAYDGEQLAGEIFELIRRRLPDLDVADPLRPMFHAVLPGLGAALGRPTMALVVNAGGVS